MVVRFRSTPNQLGNSFPFRHDNRNPDGTWDAPDATDDNIRGTSVDPHEPVWPRWTRTPPLNGEGEFVSSAPFFDIDEITQRRRSTRPAPRFRTAISMAIRRAGEESATLPPAICGDGACWSSGEKTRAASLAQSRSRSR